MLKTRVNRTLRWFRHQISNGTSEGFISRIQSIKSAARRFRAFTNYRLRILFYCETLDMKPHFSWPLNCRKNQPASYPTPLILHEESANRVRAFRERRYRIWTYLSSNPVTLSTAPPTIAFAERMQRQPLPEIILASKVTPVSRGDCQSLEPTVSLYVDSMINQSVSTKKIADFLRIAG
jgi:hypothetical protein